MVKLFRRREPGDDPVVTFLRLHQAYLSTGNPNLLRAAPALADAAIARCPPGDPRRAEVLSGACVVLRVAYQVTRQEPLLARAIASGRAAVAAIPSDDPAHLAALSGLGNALLEEFTRAGDEAVLAEAAECRRTVLRLIPQNHPELPGSLVNLGNTLLVQAERLGDEASLGEAITAYRRALHADVPGNGSYANGQAGLAQALILQLARNPSLVTLEEAAHLLREALTAFPPHHPARAELTAKLALLDQASAVAQLDATESSGAGSDIPGSEGGGGEPVTPSAAAESEYLLGRYEQTGQLSLLTKAIQTLRAVLGAGRPLAPADRQHAAHALGTALWSLFERTGDRAVLDEGITLLDTAAGMTAAPEEQRLKSQANLAGALRLRAEHTGSQADLERSVELTRDLVERTPPTDPNRPGRLGGLAGALRSLALSTGESELARKAVEQQRAAIAAHEAQARAGVLPETLDAYGPDAVPAHVFSDLGLFLMTVHEMTGETAALDEAVEQ